MIPHQVSEGSQFVGIRLSPEILAKVDEQARVEMRTRANLVRKIVAEYYNEA